MQKDGGVQGGPPRRGFGKNSFLGEDLGENLKSVIFKVMSARREKSHKIIGKERAKKKKERKEN